MLKSLILILENSAPWAPDEWLINQGGQRMATGEVILDPGQEWTGWLSVMPLADLAGDYAPEELKAIRRNIKNPRGFLVEWRDDAMIAKLRAAIPSNTATLLDSDDLPGL